jgi:hypothetical protein
MDRTAFGLGAERCSKAPMGTSPAPWTIPLRRSSSIRYCLHCNTPFGIGKVLCALPTSPRHCREPCGSRGRGQRSSLMTGVHVHVRDHFASAYLLHVSWCAPLKMMLNALGYPTRSMSLKYCPLENNACVALWVL